MTTAPKKLHEQDDAQPYKTTRASFARHAETYGLALVDVVHDAAIGDVLKTLRRDRPHAFSEAIKCKVERKSWGLVRHVGDQRSELRFQKGDEVYYDGAFCWLYRSEFTTSSGKTHSTTIVYI